MLKIKKIKPMFNRILVTADKYEKDVKQGGVVVVTAGTLKEYQKVISVGDTVRGIKEGDFVLINPARYAVKKHKEGSLKDGIVSDNPVVSYNFNFVDEASKITLKVGGTEYIVNQQPAPLPEGETSHYYFINPNTQTDGDGINPDFELIYVKGNSAEEEHFTWNIKVPVSNFAPVQLTYSVELIDPKKAPGTYGQYDADGSKGYTALYTNNRATLYPIDSNGNQGTSEAFNKPTVSYTIAGQETETPTPSVPTYYPDYSEQPVATPTPTPFVPSDETSPKTGAGDAALPALMIVALAAAGVAVVSMRKRAR